MVSRKGNIRGSITGAITIIRSNIQMLLLPNLCFTHLGLVLGPEALYPLCPYPTQQVWRPLILPMITPQQQGVLGSTPRPQQAAQQALLAPGSFHPTELSTFFNSLSLQPPDSNWCMDTGATYHLMYNSGINHSVVNWRNFNSHILVGDGSKIPVKGSGTSFFLTPLFPSLSKIFSMLKIIKNLISICHFSTDNCVSV